MLAAFLVIQFLFVKRIPWIFKSSYLILEPLDCNGICLVMSLDLPLDLLDPTPHAPVRIHVVSFLYGGNEGSVSYQEQLGMNPFDCRVLCGIDVCFLSGWLL